MLPDRVSNPGPLTYESGALPIALRGLAFPLRVNPLWKDFGLNRFYFTVSIKIQGLKLPVACCKFAA